MKAKQQTAWLLLIGMAALLIRLAPLARHDLTFQTGWDAADYIPLAQGIEHGCGFARLVNGHCGSPDVSRPPGYPYFVALMSNLRTVLVVQAILGAALCVWLGWFVSARWGVKAGLLAETLLAIDIPTIVYGAMIMSEATFQFLLTGAILLQLSAIMAAEWTWRATAQGIAAAVMLAAAAMLRPTGIFLPLFAPIPFLILFRRTNWLRASALMVLAFAITLAPMMAWTVRNRSVGVNIPSSDSAVTLYYYGAAGVLAYATHRPFDEVSVELAREVRRQGDPYTPGKLAHGMIRKSLEIYATHP
jgi:4-amino-4-deoxy-L-arabinose transferase-like glycosyltransferase